jgi:hypothetical protein
MTHKIDRCCFDELNQKEEMKGGPIIETAGSSNITQTAFHRVLNQIGLIFKIVKNRQLASIKQTISLHFKNGRLLQRFML